MKLALKNRRTRIQTYGFPFGAVFHTPARNASRSDAGGPSLHSRRGAGFEDDDEDENEAPCEHLQPAARVQFREGVSSWVDTPFLQATTFEHEHEHEHERRTPNAERQTRGAKRQTPNARRLMSLGANVVAWVFR
jgi:hypothetical protein